MTPATAPEIKTRTTGLNPDPGQTALTRGEKVAMRFWNETPSNQSGTRASTATVTRWSATSSPAAAVSTSKTRPSSSHQGELLVRAGGRRAPLRDRRALPGGGGDLTACLIRSSSPSCRGGRLDWASPKVFAFLRALSRCQASWPSQKPA